MEKLVGIWWGKGWTELSTMPYHYCNAQSNRHCFQEVSGLVQLQTQRLQLLARVFQEQKKALGHTSGHQQRKHQIHTDSTEAGKRMVLTCMCQYCTPLCLGIASAAIKAVITLETRNNTKFLKILFVLIKIKVAL